jgi:hypothetical protein
VHLALLAATLPEADTLNMAPGGRRLPRAARRRAEPRSSLDLVVVQRQAATGPVYTLTFNTGDALQVRWRGGAHRGVRAAPRAYAAPRARGSRGSRTWRRS